MGKANRINLGRDEAIRRLNTLVDELNLELYDNGFDSTNPDDVIFSDLIEHLKNIIELLKYCQNDIVSFFRIYVGVRKKGNTSLHLVLPHPEITWERFSKLK